VRTGNERLWKNQFEQHHGTETVRSCRDRAEQVLAEAKDHDGIITKARDGRGPVSIWEISVQAYLDESVTIRALMLWVHGLMKAANEQIARWMDEQS